MTAKKKPDPAAVLELMYKAQRARELMQMLESGARVVAALEELSKIGIAHTRDDRERLTKLARGIAATAQTILDCAPKPDGES